MKKYEDHAHRYTRRSLNYTDKQIHSSPVSVCVSHKTKAKWRSLTVLLSICLCISSVFVRFNLVVSLPVMIHACRVYREKRKKYKKQLSALLVYGFNVSSCCVPCVPYTVYTEKSNKNGHRCKPVLNRQTWSGKAMHRRNQLFAFFLLTLMWI